MCALRSNLRQEILAVDISLTSKTPFKTLVLLESLSHRLVDFADAARLLYQEGCVVPAITLTRSAFEVTAMGCSMFHKITKCLESEAIDVFDRDIMQLLFGQRQGDESLPEAINVLTLLDKMAKDIPALKEYYMFLCEYAHPNMYGTKGAYSKTIHEEHRTTFGRVHSQNMAEVGIQSMIAAVVMFEHYRNEINKLMPKFITLCENTLSGSVR